MRGRAIVLRREPPPSGALLTARLRLAGLVAEVTALEERLEREARDLARFEARWRDATGEAAADMERSRQLLRKVRRLAGEVDRLAALGRGSPPLAARRAVGRAEAPRRAGGPAASPRGEPTCPPDRASGSPGRGARAGAAELASAAVAQARRLELRALYRRLARALHPDLSRADGAERAHRSHLMARANDAYARGDHPALQLLAERVGAAEAPPDVPEPERLLQLARRIATAEASRAALLAAGDRLASSPAARLREEAARREAEGGEPLAEARDATLEEARAARAEAVAALDRLAAAARAVPLPAARGGAPGRRSRGDAGPSVLVRAGEVRLEASTPTPGARVLARWLVDRARGENWWEAALHLLAFAGELAGRPPPSLATASALCVTWEALRAGRAPAPELAAALASLPRGLEIGLRRAGGALEAGLQLASADLGGGVTLALRTEPVRALARGVLAALGPRARCRACREEVGALHLLRLAGLEEVHGLVCSRCGALLRSFWRFGEPVALEALLPLALEVGLVAEVRLRFGGAAFAMQMLGRERQRLTARALSRRFRDACLLPAGVEVPPAALELRAAGEPLAPRSAVPSGAPLVLRLPEGAASTARGAVAAVRRHARRRFRA